MFFIFFYVFLYFFNFVFLLSLKQKRTKLQISCISHGKRLNFLDRSSVLYQYYWLVVRNRAEFWTFFALPNFRGPAFQKLYPFYHPCSFNVFSSCFKMFFLKVKKTCFYVLFLFENHVFNICAKFHEKRYFAFQEITTIVANKRTNQPLTNQPTNMHDHKQNRRWNE